MCESAGDRNGYDVVYYGHRNQKQPVLLKTREFNVARLHIDVNDIHVYYVRNYSSYNNVDLTSLLNHHKTFYVKFNRLL